MVSAENNNKSFLDNIYWLNHDEAELLKQVLPNGEEDLFTYLLPQRSCVEAKINKVAETLSLNKFDEEELDELVYRYNISIAAALDSVDNWIKSRDMEQFEVDSLLYLEGMELEIALHSLEVLKINGRALFEFLRLHKV